MNGLSRAGALDYAATVLESSGEAGTTSATILLRQCSAEAPDSYPNGRGERATYVGMTPTQVYERLLATMGYQTASSSDGRALKAALPKELEELTDRFARCAAQLVWNWLDEQREEMGK